MSFFALDWAFLAFSIRNKIAQFCFILISCRLKRQSSKLSTPEILALLELYEANERTRYGNDNDDAANFDNYRKPLFMPSSSYGNPDDETSDGEWWNDYMEPSIQFYGNPPPGHVERAPLDIRAPYKSNWLSDRAAVPPSLTSSRFSIDFSHVAGQTVHGFEEEALAGPHSARWALHRPVQLENRLRIRQPLSPGTELLNTLNDRNWFLPKVKKIHVIHNIKSNWMHSGIYIYLIKK